MMVDFCQENAEAQQPGDRWVCGPDPLVMRGGKIRFGFKLCRSQHGHGRALKYATIVFPHTHPDGFSTPGAHFTACNAASKQLCALAL
ncbi:MAG: hypothetical protein ACT4P0_08660 [Panacagrimonas sp.]